jgi:Tfp pilus assembly protein FimT
MNRIKNNESGFSAVEIVMVIVIVGLIGAVGYLVYKNYHKTTKTIVVTKVVKAPAQSSSSMAVNSNIIKFPELGVEVTVPDSLKTIKYTMVGDIAYVTDSSKDTNSNNYGGNCSIAALSKVSGQYSSTSTTSGAPDPLANPLAKQFSNFYITYGHPQAICGSTTTETTQFSNDTAAFSKALATISLIQ